MTFLFLFFLVLSLFYKSQLVNFKENYHFQGSGGGPTFSRGLQLFPGGGGGSNFFQGGSNCLFPIETYIMCYSRGVLTPWPPWIRTCGQIDYPYVHYHQSFHYTHNYEGKGSFLEVWPYWIARKTRVCKS